MTTRRLARVVVRPSACTQSLLAVAGGWVGGAAAARREPDASPLATDLGPSRTGPCASSHVCAAPRSRQGELWGPRGPRAVGAYSSIEHDFLPSVRLGEHTRSTRSTPVWSLPWPMGRGITTNERA